MASSSIGALTARASAIYCAAGVANWTDAGEVAAVCVPANAAWYQPVHGFWLGDASAAGALGNRNYTLPFALSTDEAACAAFVLHYLVDNVLISAHLNGQALTVGSNPGFGAPFPRSSAIIAAEYGAGLFGEQNELVLVMANMGTTTNLFGLYSACSAEVGPATISARVTPLLADLVCAVAPCWVYS